jgi:hypothetical protein
MAIKVYLKDREEAVDIFPGQEPEWISFGATLVGGPTSVLRVKDSQGKLVADERLLVAQFCCVWP